MKRISILFILALLCWLPFGFAQTPGAVPEKQDPLKDSIDKYKKAELYDKVLPFAEQWVSKLKKEKKENTADYGRALSSLGIALNRNGKSQEAEPILLQSLEIRKKVLGENHLDVATSLNSLGNLYKNMRNYIKAEPYYLQALEIRKKAQGPEHPEVGFLLNNLGVLYDEMGDYAKAAPYYQQTLEIRKKTQGPEHPDVATSLHNLGVLYYYLGNYSKAETYYQQALEIRKKVLGPEHPEVGALLSNLGALYEEMADYTKAEPYYQQTLEILKKALGPEHPDVGTLLNNLGILYDNMGDYSKAETYYQQALEIRKKALGPEHPDVASSLHNLGVLYGKMGYYAKSGSYKLQALEILKKDLGPEHPDVASSLDGLGGFHTEMGDYAKAEPYYLQALEIRKKVIGPEHHEVGASLSNLGVLYDLMGNYAKAEPNKLQALEIKKKALGPEHPDVGDALNNLGVLYDNMGDYAKARTLYLQALDILKKALGPDHPAVGASLNNLGLLYNNIGDYAKSEPYYLQALEIKKKALGQEHPDVAYSLDGLGVLYWNMGDFSKAEPNYLQALEIRKKALGSEHPDVGDALSNLGILNHGVPNYPKAEGFYLNWNTNKKGQIQRYFPFLSDNEKAKFYDSKLSGKQANFLSFCVDRYPGQKAIAGILYNDQLATKGLLLNSAAKWKHRIKTAGDKKLNRLYDDWETSRNKLNKLLQSTDSTERAGIDSVERKTEKMEKELSLRSENFAKLADKKLVNWKDVQKALKPGEAAVEIVRVKKFGIEKTVTDTSDPKKPVYQVKGLTDTIYYAALIVKPGSIIPEMVILKNGNDMEGKYLKYYQNLIKNKLDDNKSYQQFWQKIGTRLEGSKRIYFSPDGVYHNLNLNTLFNPKTKKYLLEEKDIRIVTVTKDIVNPSPVEEDNKLAELVGFPSYYTNQTGQIAAVSERKSPELIYGLSLKSTCSLAELPGTKTEVDKIAGILTEKGWEVKNYTGSSALEENIKESYKPRLLHVATHGFFQPDTTKGSNPLLRSGLMLAGEGNTLKGEKNETGEDGILTAYEAMNLNLDNTDLVVLSACETGLGEIKNGEGVYGLQRAFKVAGAKSIIMSLWKVSDQATQELMVSFYRNWLGNAVGASAQTANSKRSAFLKAQKELKAKYPDPYYWGAFVMVGE
jgi:tetratricopeptide (TPR) repeat protein